MDLMFSRGMILEYLIGFATLAYSLRLSAAGHAHGRRRENIIGQMTLPYGDISLIDIIRFLEVSF